MGFEIEFTRDSPPEECGGGQPLEACPTAAELLSESKPFTPDRVQGSNPEARWNHLIFLSRQCGQCALKCGVAVVIKERAQTGQVKLTYTTSPEMSPEYLSAHQDLG